MHGVAAGTNWSGEWATNQHDNPLSPGQVAGLSDIVSIAAAGGHNVAVKRDGTVWVWGGNFHGELGVERNADRPTPVR